MGAFDPPLNPARGNPVHRVIDQPGGVGLDDAWDNVFPQAGSQWDSLAHIGRDREVYYNGATAEQIRREGRNGIDVWAAHGIAGRGVLLDMPASMAAAGRAYDPSATVEFGVDDLERARRDSGVEFRTGDVLLLHTGFTGWYVEQDRATRAGLPGHVTAPGLEHTEEICAYLWDQGIAAVGSDTFAVEAWPADTSAEAAPFGFIHHVLIGSLGMALGELWWLRDLALDCRRTGVHEGMFVSTPTRAPGGISSAANAVVLM
nr:cyclase family protein [Nocardioides flavescens]